MNPFQEFGLDLDRCPSCDGMWFDFGELEAYRRRRREQGNPPSIEKAEFRREPGNYVLHCPRCLFPSLTLGNINSIELRRCLRCHGLFLPKPSWRDGGKDESELSLEAEGVLWLGEAVLEMLIRASLE